MLEITGKYNTARIMTNEIDESTRQQVCDFLSSVVMDKCNIVIMPDCHAGAGAVVGFTSTLVDKLCPNIVGVDIGCGIMALNLGKINVNFEKLEKFIRDNIPLGFNRHDTVPKDFEWMIDKEKREILDIVDITGQNPKSVLCSLGTLGGGNHFLEVDKDDNDTLWLVIHTGSRNFGLQVANFYQQGARRLNLPNTFKNLEYMPIDSTEGEGYLYSMTVAQSYASLNRQLIAYRITKDFFGMSGFPENFMSVHNYIDIQNKIIRKGAISAYSGERVIIPLNMRDGSIIGKGLGNPDWNFSAPHGAGRVLSRTQAKKTLELKDFKESMKGIATWSVSENTLDEAPKAYKDKSVIINSIGNTVSIDKFITPVYNLKASEDNSGRDRRHKLTKEEKADFAKRYAKTMGHSKELKRIEEVV